MNPRLQRITSVLALFLVFSTSQVYVGVSFATSTSANAFADPPPPKRDASTGVLTTVGNKPIIVNGADSISGATILSGASIETPEAVTATVSLKTGKLEIEPQGSLTLNFQPKSIKVTLLKGCVTLHTNKRTEGEIDTGKGVVEKIDPKKGGMLRVCHPDSVMTAPVHVAAAGLNLLTMGGVVAAPVASIVPVVLPGDDPSPSTPTN